MPLRRWSVGQLRVYQPMKYVEDTSRTNEKTVSKPHISISLSGCDKGKNRFDACSVTPLYIVHRIPMVAVAAFLFLAPFVTGNHQRTPKERKKMAAIVLSLFPVIIINNERNFFGVVHNDQSKENLSLLFL